MYFYMLFNLFFQYLNDVEELENWINDKMALATSKDYGKDENSADKLLTKNKVGRTSMLVNFYKLNACHVFSA